VEGAKGRSHEGTGIGLALLQELVKIHGGKIEVTSNLGAGTTFEVSIPLGTKHLVPDQITCENVCSGSERKIGWLSDDLTFECNSKI